ncbi:conserved Plasmodium membrane protein, unknown function [Plasmodium sp. gorilla clade G2]|uniref:conserved Plasmodium membrane protein, unknown function n=1 Tax=Plasmodium sp. gorilla clade G2 TaxID=880535 RepID=UPI000D21CEEC|nr:conserved Plasmodium membrane protein, unknown function [Plasmodium sp. gorilla clade G2]SOV10197.1 conserved Plasmodium membrane protein, unknown function [Plasmodium sp. gorilla clade G2]
MGDFNDLSVELKKTELIKEELKNLSHIIHNEFNFFCQNENKNIIFSNNIKNSYNDDIFSTSTLNNLYTSWKLEDFSHFDFNSILDILKRNQYVMCSIYFLIIFSCLYFLTLLLYTKCIKRMLKKWFCKYCTSHISENSSHNEDRTLLQSVMKKSCYFITYSFITFLLLLLLLSGITYMHYFIKTKRGIHDNICNIYTKIDAFLLNKCTDPNTVDISCYSAEHILTDVDSILKEYKKMKLRAKDDSLLDENTPFPLLERYITTFNKLNILKENINKNNEALENGYFHTYPALTGISETLTTILNEGNKNFDNARKIIKEVKSTIKYSFHTIDETIRNIFNDNLPKFTELITKAGNSIKGINNKYKIKERIPKYTNIILLTNIVLLLPPLLILLGIIIFMIYILIGNIQKNNNFFIKLFGHFSAYFGFLTIVILSFGILFLSTSIIGGTTCILSERILKNELRFDILNNTLIDYCIKNENAPLIDDNITTTLVSKINSFDTGSIDKNINEYEKHFTTLKTSFYENSLNFMDYIWVVIVKQDHNMFLNRIRNEEVKLSLLTTSIINENIKFGDVEAMGIKSYLNELNRIIFQGINGKICFNDIVCEKEANTYNITENSKTDDQKYLSIRNQVNDQYKDDLDLIIQLFVYKARILKEKIFDINDLDSNEKNKIGWSEYTPRNTHGTQKKSIINTFLINVIESINFSEIIYFFDKMKDQFNVLKSLILLKIDTLTKNTNCNKFVKELIDVRKDYCNKIVLNLSTLSIYLIIFAITSFLLWYLFLFLWFYYNIKPS